MRPIADSRRKSQGGMALLLVSLMAATAALMLYRELPRVAFQSQRQKEQMLMERGQEYQHAIGLFVRANSNRWPASVEELESFNGKRYLRRRYIDPMTGKDEWRMIHIQNGILTDSVNSKPPSTQQTSNNGTGIVAEIPLTNGGMNAPGAVNPALRRRPSDGGAQTNADGSPITGGFGGLPGVTGASGIPGATGTTGTNPGLPGMGAFPGGISPISNGNGTNGAPGLPGVPGVPTAANGTTGQTGSTGSNSSNGGGLFGSSSSGGLFASAPTPAPATGTTGQPGLPGQLPNGIGGIPGVPGQSPLPGQTATTNNTGTPGLTINPQSQAAAAGLIQNLLTTPRPGGLAGIQSAQQQSANTVGGGIAGVASKYDSDSIMLYSDKQNYAEWEFIYDPSKYRRPPPPTSGVGLGTQNTGGLFASNSGSSSTTSAGGSALPAGQANGSFGNNGFGSTPGTQGATGATGAAGTPGTTGAFGSSFFPVSAGGSNPGAGGPNGMGAPVGSSPMGTPGMPGAQGANGQAVAPGSGGFGGGGGIDIRPGRAN